MSVTAEKEEKDAREIPPATRPEERQALPLHANCAMSHHVEKTTFTLSA